MDAERTDAALIEESEGCVTEVFRRSYGRLAIMVEDVETSLGLDHFRRCPALTPHSFRKRTSPPHRRSTLNPCSPKNSRET